jgi:16S rRNA (adenine1518-N6/adenine1519-N6)-dimethyltransferase
MVSEAPRAGRRQRRLGQNFLADPNLLDLIVREARLAASDVVLEVGGGAGALSEPLAPAAGHLHVIEMDQRLHTALAHVEALPNVALHWGDAMKLDLGGLEPAPNRMVSNLPYSVATPLLLRTIAELPSIEEWLVMVQRELAERLRASPGSRTYGSPSAMVQLSCRVELVRPVGREVFRPAPRVDSALVRLTRTGPAPSAAVATTVRAAFAHRRKALARSLELAGVADRPTGRKALAEIGLAEDARAEALSPEQFAALAEKL